MWVETGKQLEKKLCSIEDDLFGIMFSDPTALDWLNFNLRLSLDIAQAAESGKAQEIQAIMIAAARHEQVIVKPSSDHLRLAVERGQAECVEMLLHYGVDPYCELEPEKNALNLAIEHGHSGCVRMLLSCGVDVDRLLANKTALYWATYYGNWYFVDLLLEHEANAELAGLPDFVPFLHVQDRDTASLLLENSCDVDVVDSKGNSALYKAVARGNFEVAEILLQAGADTDACSQRLGPPLVAAAERRDCQLVSLLLEHGADVELANARGETALIVACKLGDEGSISSLLANCANPNAKDVRGATPLHYATTDPFWDDDASSLDDIEECTTECTKKLIEYGADPDAVEKDGRTPLSRPLFLGKERVVEALVKAGATNPGHKDGVSALQFADENKWEAAAVFRAHILKFRMRKLRGIVRFIIVSSRYRENFYRYKYVEIGAVSFAKGQKAIA